MTSEYNWAAVSAVRPGVALVAVEPAHKCLTKGATYRVFKDHIGLYVQCTQPRPHYLVGCLDFEHSVYVGFVLADENKKKGEPIGPAFQYAGETTISQSPRPQPCSSGKDFSLGSTACRSC